MRISAKVEYALRVMAELAALRPDELARAEDLASAQTISVQFLTDILGTLRSGRLVHSQRGSHGGYRMARPPAEITLADVMRCMDGPLVTFAPSGLAELSYAGPAECLSDVWMALRASMRSVLEEVTVADLAARSLPPRVQELADHYLDQQELRAGSYQR